MNHIISFLNQKGGVGKTTSVANISKGLLTLGKKVLAIDLDPQANLTYSFGIQAHELEASVYEVLKGECSITDVSLVRNGVEIVPASLELSGAEMEFSSIPGREFLLSQALKKIPSVDYVLIDCPPSLGLLTLNALTTASEIWIPLQMEFLPVQGIAKLIQTVDIVRERLNPDLQITGVICTRFDKRKRLNNEVADMIMNHFGDTVFKTFIRENISIAEAPSFGQTIFDYKPNSRGAQDFLTLCREILARG